MALLPDHFNLTSYLGPIEAERTTHSGEIGPPPLLLQDDTRSDHCVDYIRHYIMCHADATSLVWKCNHRNNISITNMGVAQTCYNRDSISVWAYEHKMEGPFDRIRHIPRTLEW
jgi:hypothetical protein